MKSHPLVEHILDAFGFAETLGEEIVYDLFFEWCRSRKTHPSEVSKTDNEVSLFIDWFYDRQGEDEEEELEDEIYETQAYDEEDNGDIKQHQGKDKDSIDHDHDRLRPSHHPKNDDYSEDSEDLPRIVDLKPGRTKLRPYIDMMMESDDDDVEKDPIECSSDDGGDGIEHHTDASHRHHRQRDLFSFLHSKKVDSQDMLKDTTHDYNRPATQVEMALDDLDFVNKMVFGNLNFRSRQRDIVSTVLQGRDTFVLMPTGGGKSLCYQLPAVISKGVTVVITPLLSLMQDQVQALCNLPTCGGVPATYLSSQQTKTESYAVISELSKPYPSMKLLYVTPEQFVQGLRLQHRLKVLHSKGLLARLVIDECHCVSQWGHDFRKEYQQIGRVKSELFPDLGVVALTATATQTVRQDVLTSLRMRNPAQFIVSFFRDNLIFRVIPKVYTVDKETKMPQWQSDMLSYIAHRPEDTGIVYCLSREDAEQMAARIRNTLNISARHYHAGMTPKQRTEVQNEWRQGTARVVAATIAFGMGIDHATVRYVLHATMSKSLEGYYQEAGRAGRDGKPAECILYYGKADVPRLMNLMRRNKKKSGNAAFQREIAHLNAVTAYCLESTECRHAQLLKYFGESWSQSRCESLCDVCRGDVVPIMNTSSSGGSRRGGGGGGGGGSKKNNASSRAAQTSNKNGGASKEKQLPIVTMPTFTSAAAALNHLQAAQGSKVNGNKKQQRPTSGGNGDCYARTMTKTHTTTNSIFKYINPGSSK